jgi:hypothetical protein
LSAQPRAAPAGPPAPLTFVHFVNYILGRVVDDVLGALRRLVAAKTDTSSGFVLIKKMTRVTFFRSAMFMPLQ